MARLKVLAPVHMYIRLFCAICPFTQKVHIVSERRNSYKWMSIPDSGTIMDSIFSCSYEYGSKSSTHIRVWHILILSYIVLYCLISSYLILYCTSINSLKMDPITGWPPRSAASFRCSEGWSGKWDSPIPGLKIWTSLPFWFGIQIGGKQSLVSSQKIDPQEKCDIEWCDLC